MAELQWWQKAVFYQIYPRSFADGNGDGIGDFAGMIEKLDYLRDLGIDAIWLSPHYPSPLADCGYDISDYTGVAPEYGTLDDVRRLLEAAHSRDMRVIFDLVLNHTSDQHPWFIESRSSRDNPKRDWYVWRDGKDGAPPNNWYSQFGGSAWELEQATGQYYYHFFLKQQPDLNWNNPQVRQAMWDAVRFWLDLGVDGFRLDAIGTIFEHPDLPDHTARLTQVELYLALQAATSDDERQRLAQQAELMFGYQTQQPGIHALMQELRALIDQYPGRMLVGEDDLIEYYGNGSNELQLVFNFPLIQTPRLTPTHIRTNQVTRLAALPPGAWPCNTLGNHDSPRLWSRFGDGQHNAALARLHVALILTLRGTPFLYNGEEIGMTELPPAEITQFRDTPGLIAYQIASDVLGLPPTEALKVASSFTRDGCRTPMQWSNAPNAGFSPEGVQPWLPVNPDYAQGINVADQSGDTKSLLNFYRRLLQVRRQNPALVAGDYDDLHEHVSDYFAFLRFTPEQSCLVVLNMSERERVIGFHLPDRHVQLLFSSHARPHDTDDLVALRLAPFEVYIGNIQ